MVLDYLLYHTLPCLQVPLATGSKRESEMGYWHVGPVPPVVSWVLNESPKSGAVHNPRVFVKRESWEHEEPLNNHQVARDDRTQ